MRYIRIPQKSKKPKIIIVLLSVFLLLFGLWYLLTPKSNTTDSPLDFIFNRGPNINSTDDKVNILLLGNAGGKHDGADLTDTIMIASINYKTHQVHLISLPRDLWIETVKGKINSVYERGGSGEDGLSFSKKTFGDLLGMPIHYAIRVNFDGFVQAVDEVGGIEVDVEKSFDDYLYPITGKEDDMCGYTEQEKDFNEEEAKQLNISAGKRKVLIAADGKISTDSGELDKGYQYFTCRYEHIGYKKGVNHMDGSTALKFVRSRMGSNGEGSDFARSSRQQRALESLRTKILSLNTLINPGKVTSLIGIFGDNFSTDLDIPDVIELYGIVKEVTGTSSFVISNSGENPLLIHPGIGEYGAWVLVPRDKSYNEIREYIKKILMGEITNDESSPPARSRDN